MAATVYSADPRLSSWRAGAGGSWHSHPGPRRGLAKAGDVIENVPMGGRIIFRRTARETAGELLQFDFFLRPHKGVARAHLHPVQEERFRVVSGTMRGRVAGAAQTVASGGSVVVSPGTPHIWWNDSDGEAHLEVEFRPALN